MTMLIPAPGQIHRALGGQIDVRVEIDTGLAGSSFMLWDVGEWDVDNWGSVEPDWADVTDFVEQIEINQGTERWGDRFETGSAVLTLDNTDGRFTPESGFSPFHLPFRPRRRLRVVAIPDPDDPTTKEPQFTGFIDSIIPQFDEGGYLLSVQINCLDFMALWGGHDPVALETPTGVQDTDVRVGAALDRADWPDDADHRDIQTGEHTMQSSHLAQTTLEECQRAADAEGGHFFCSKDGKATFKARDWLMSDARSTAVQGYLGFDSVPTGANTAHVESVEPSWETARIVNLVEFARVGSTMQVVEDEVSQGLFDVKSYQRTDLENNTDAEVLFLATRYLGQFNTDRMRIDAITISANADPDNEDLNRLMWDSQFGDLLKVRAQTPYGWKLEKFVKIMGISHRITAEDWQVTFKLDDVFIFVGGSVMEIELEFQGGGEASTRSGGSEMTIGLEFEGAGASTSKQGGSEMEISIDMEGDGFKDRAGLMGVLAPVAWWQFEHLTDFEEDSSGNGHGLNWNGTASLSDDGPISPRDSYISLNGSSNFATVTDEAALELRQDMSIECWVRIPSSQSGADVLIDCDTSAGNDLLFRIQYAFGHIAASPGDSGSITIGASAAIPEDQWVHMVATFDWAGSGRTILLYIDGDLADTFVSTYQPGVATRAINIGRDVSGASQYWTGDVSELTIFDRVLTADEVQELYESRYG